MDVAVNNIRKTNAQHIPQIIELYYAESPFLKPIPQIIDFKVAELPFWFILMVVTY